MLATGKIRRRLPSPSCAMVACATNPATGKREFSLMSEAQEIQLGQQMDGQVRQEMGVYNDPELQRYVEDVGDAAGARVRTAQPAVALHRRRRAGGQRVRAAGRLHLRHARHPAVPARRGGARRRARPRDRARDGPSFGAAVHEGDERRRRPHAARRSSCRRRGRSRASPKPHWACCSSSTDATTSCRPTGWACDTPAATGWDPAGVAGMLRTLARLDEASGARRGVPNWLSTHPAPADRVEQVQAMRRRVPRTATDASATNDAEFLRRIDGIVFGDSPSDGIVRGNTFLHPELRLSIAFPPRMGGAATQRQQVDRQSA